ncbi:hypothetical protein SULYE_1019 [Sulfurihydrogenibium yellowstonense SS-5]|uniref:Uncharacterized protein n=1 Tax=Sulfurihydrogenibium yellowstonense SS-5 TaxID=432331 RepID=C4FKB9_9AQUI|nr:hypothetical protein SULYE_1019 [Sulfurihydrogenibium yellowstonense SS-5]
MTRKGKLMKILEHSQTIIIILNQREEFPIFLLLNQKIKK